MKMGTNLIETFDSHLNTSVMEEQQNMQLKKITYDITNFSFAHSPSIFAAINFVAEEVKLKIRLERLLLAKRMMAEIIGEHRETRSWHIR